MRFAECSQGLEIQDGLGQSSAKVTKSARERISRTNRIQGKLKFLSPRVESTVYVQYLLQLSNKKSGTLKFFDITILANISK